MGLRVALVVRTEFLRLVLRQLLHRQISIDIVAEASDPAAALGLPDGGCLIIERSLYHPAIVPPHRGRIIVIADGADATIPPGTAEVTVVPAGTLETKLDPAALGTRLEAALKTPPPPLREPPPQTAPEPPAPRRAKCLNRPALIAIAASTGGPEVLQVLFQALHRPVCPIVVALHIPKEHTASLARHLAAVSGHPVVVGEAGPLPQQGIVLLQGGVDHAVTATAHGLSLRAVRGGASNFHPNADILLSSAAALEDPVVGIVLTGMGNDGCEGAKALTARGYPVLAQRPSSCAVAGMPSAAIAAGAVSDVASPEGIAARLNEWFRLP